MVVQKAVAVFIHYLLVCLFQSLQKDFRYRSRYLRNGQDAPLDLLQLLRYTLWRQQHTKKGTRALPVSPPWTYFSWPLSWLYAWHGFLQSHTYQDLESVTSPHGSFPTQAQSVLRHTVSFQVWEYEKCLSSNKKSTQAINQNNLEVVVRIILYFYIYRKKHDVNGSNESDDRITAETDRVSSPPVMQTAITLL